MLRLVEWVGVGLLFLTMCWSCLRLKYELDISGKGKFKRASWTILIVSIIFVVFIQPVLRAYGCVSWLMDAGLLFLMCSMLNFVFAGTYRYRNNNTNK